MNGYILNYAIEDAEITHTGTYITPDFPREFMDRMRKWYGDKVTFDITRVLA